MTLRPLVRLAAWIALAIALAPSSGMAAEGDHDGRWRLEYACGRNSANGAAPFSSRIELPVQGGALSARTASRNNRLNRDDVEQWSGGFDGTSISIRTAGSASDGASWEYEWSGAASSPTEGSVAGALFASVRGARSQLRSCEGTLVLVEPASSSLAATAAARQKEAEEAAARQKATEEAARNQRVTAPERAPVAVLVSPQATLEAFLEAHAGHRGLDLVLLADVGRSAKGAFQRGVSGGLVLGQKTFCVEAPLLYAEPERAPIPLRALGEVRDGVPEVVGARTAYGALASSPARLVAAHFRVDSWDGRGALAPEWELRFSSIASTIAFATREKFGPGAVVSVTISEKCREAASAQLVPRVFLQPDIEELLAPAADPQRRAGRTPTLKQRFNQVADQLAIIARGDFVEAAILDVASLRAIYARRSEAEDQKRQKQADFLDELANSATAGAGARYGAIVLGTGTPRGRLQPCAVKRDGGEVPVADLALVLRGDGIRDAVPGGAEPLRAFDSLDELFIHLKKANRSCGVVVGNGRTLAALRVALERDGVPHAMVWHAITQAQLGEIKADTLGYRAMEGRTALQAWVFAFQIGKASPQEIEVLAELGIMAKPGYDEAMARLAAARDGDAANVQGLIGFLQDERAAQDRRMTVGELRAYRRAVKRRDEQAAEAVALGFRAVAGRGAEEAMAFAREIGGATPGQVEALRTLGIESKAGYDEAMARLAAAREGDEANVQGLIGYLRDETEARQRGISVARLRADREAAERRAAVEAEAARREQEKRRAAEFPFVAEFTCSVSQQTTMLEACLSGSAPTEIEIRNQGQHHVYKIHEISNMGEWNGRAVVVELSQHFEIKAQNASENLVLGLVVRDRASGAVRYQREAGRFSVLAVHN